MKNLKQKLGIILVAISLLAGIGLLISQTNDDYNRNIDLINRSMAEKMADCWQQVEETGGTCQLEYIYVDDGQTPVGAEVVKKGME